MVENHSKRDEKHAKMKNLNFSDGIQSFFGKFNEFCKIERYIGVFLICSYIIQSLFFLNFYLKNKHTPIYRSL